MCNLLYEIKIKILQNRWAKLIRKSTMDGDEVGIEKSRAMGVKYGFMGAAYCRGEKEIEQNRIATKKLFKSRGIDLKF